MNTDLRDIAGDFRMAAQCLTHLITRLEKVAGASQEPVNRVPLDTLYRIRDGALVSHSELMEIVDSLERRGR